MSEYYDSNFLCNVYSDELVPSYIDEIEQVNKLMAEPDDWQGYSQWSEETEASAWQGSKQVAGILIKKACEHSDCPHTRCAKSLRLGGIEI
jgi:hypothetical protein